MNTHTSTPVELSAGMRVRVMDMRGDVVGGGVILAVDMLRVTVAQPYVWRENGVITERGETPAHYSLACHIFEPHDGTRSA